MGNLLASCVLGCAFVQLALYQYGELSMVEYFLYFHFCVIGATLLYGALGGPIVIGGLVIYGLTCSLFLIVFKLDAQNKLNREQVAEQKQEAAKDALRGYEKE